MEIFPNMQISEGAIKRYHALMGRVWDQRRFSEQLWEASKAFLKSEQAYRSAALVETLRLPPEAAKNYTDNERIFNDLGLAHLDAARDLLKRFM